MRVPRPLPFLRVLGTREAKHLDVVDRTTFADLMRENRERNREYVGDWII